MTIFSVGHMWKGGKMPKMSKKKFIQLGKRIAEEVEPKKKKKSLVGWVDRFDKFTMFRNAFNVVLPIIWNTKYKTEKKFIKVRITIEEV